MKSSSLLKYVALLAPDVVFFTAIIAFLYLKGIVTDEGLLYIIPGSLLLLAVKSFISLKAGSLFFRERIEFISTIINDFKKGRYTVARPGFFGRIRLSGLFSELSTIGKHFDDIISAQKSEIDQLREMYNNMVLSMSSYFMVLDENEEVLFANDSFCQKFQYERDEIYGRRVDSIFIFITGRIREAIASVKNSGRPTILEKSQLISKNRISIIADIKISRMVMQGRNQIVLVIDDITSRCRKDYQISLISQISESIQRDSEIDNVLYTILTGVTSGSGLGFNRAMLFLVDENARSLSGKMAVGPDSLDEAVEIWSSIPSGKVDIIDQLKSYDATPRKGTALLKRVLEASFPLGSGNLLVRAVENFENIHVYDSWRDDRLDEHLRKFMDVREFVVVPLIAVNKAIGVIVADNKFNQVPIGNDSLELLSIFAFQTALSIESYRNISRLRKEMQKITDKQDAIVESEKLAAVGRIASHIAHEIRNPLVTVGGYANRVLQLSREAAKHEAMIKNAAGVILKEPERLEKVLSNVMDFTRPSPHIRQFNNINEIVNDSADLLKNLFQERKIRVRLELDKDIPLVKSDFNQLKQVMLNLVQNAMDATPPGGEVGIATSLNGSYVNISITDSGTGIPEEDLPRIFDPFFTTKMTGVGLGLAIVKKIVNDHAGEISVRNRPGGGCECVVSLAVP